MFYHILINSVFSFFKNDIQEFVGLKFEYLEEFVGEMKNIQDVLLEFLEDESNDDGKYENLINLISTQRIINDQNEFKLLLQLINSIGNEHHRVPNFVSKLELLLRYFKKDIQK